MKEKQYIIGLDFGTDSVRALVADAATGRETATAVAAYPRWRAGKFCDPSKNRFRQHPLDHLEALEACIKAALKKAGYRVRARVAGISVDTTGSTPCAVDRTGTPLALRPGFEKNPNAMFVLWKDHTAVEEAAEINRKAKSFGPTDYTKYVGGVYSSEWFWAKMMHVFRRDPAVRRAAHSFMEHCDWVPAVLAGISHVADVKRSRCAAGHKALWHESFNGLPPESFLARLDPALKGMRQRLYDKTYPADTAMGGLSAEWAGRLGLKPGIAVGTGAFDAHMGAVGAGITPYALCKIIGTSTCDILIAPLKEMRGRVVQGICGQVNGSVIPGMLGMEAGQSAFGDLFAWFREILAWAGRTGQDGRIIERLSKEAGKIRDADTAVVALDWINGRRTPNANQMLKGAVTGLTLGTTAPAIFKGLVEGHHRPGRGGQEIALHHANPGGRSGHAHQSGAVRAGVRPGCGHVRGRGGGHLPGHSNSAEAHTERI
jgi:L-ribulokinase